jgi:hypothetical protein
VESPGIAVLLPCFNEEAAIGATVAGFRAALPGATVYVYDNNSRDGTRVSAPDQPHYRPNAFPKLSLSRRNSSRSAGP